MERTSLLRSSRRDGQKTYMERLIRSLDEGVVPSRKSHPTRTSDPVRTSDFRSEVLSFAKIRSFDRRSEVLIFA